MSEAKYTPGPWFEHREGFSTVYVEARMDGGWVQEVAACGPTEAGQAQQAANARLIAAAPELLEALERIVALSDREHDAWHAAKRAIAKAKGEPHAD